MSEEPTAEVPAVLLRVPARDRKYGEWATAQRCSDYALHRGWAVTGSDEDPLWGDLAKYYECWWPIDISAVTDGEIQRG